MVQIHADLKLENSKLKSHGLIVPKEYVDKVEAQPFWNKFDSQIKNEDNKDLNN